MNPNANFTVRRDANSIPGLIAVSSADGVSLVELWANPVTHRLLVQMIGGGGSGYQQPTSGSVDGSNTSFAWATAPDVIVVDQGRTMQRISSDGNVNWTGTTVTVLQVPPNSDIFAI